MALLPLLPLLCFCPPKLATAATPPVSLNGDWTLHFWPQPDPAVTSPDAMRDTPHKTIPAKVPGNVELDLLAAGLIRDPMIGANLWDMRPYEGHQWCYERRFPTPARRQDQKISLWFGGIDCLADIWLNGKKVASTDNMLIEHSFDVTDLLLAEKNKDNLLQVIIRSPVIEAQNHLLDVMATRDVLRNESVAIRKAPHMYGWDIMPRLVSAGLWRDVELRILDPVRFTDVHWMTTQADAKTGRAAVTVDYQLRMPFALISNCDAIVTLKRNGHEVWRKSERVITFAARQKITLPHADLWWPRGYGDPALYEAAISIVDENGNILATDKQNIGLRTVELRRTEITTSEKPGEFCFVVNGEKIFIKGTNWVPLDALHSRDPSHLQQVFAMAVDLNCNMLRCWGGNVYADSAFFDLCDRNGILVWQDFAMACNSYPQTDEFAEKIKAEVTSIVLKLRNHPSIALWSGNNEDDSTTARQMKGFDYNPNDDRISRKVIPEILRSIDPARPYLPSSPCYTQAFYDAGGDLQTLPERHLWGPRGYYKAPFYTDVPAHFVSEIGSSGCPNRESLEKMFDKDYVYPWKPGTFEWNEQWQVKAVRVHQYSHTLDDRNNLMINQVKGLFGEVPRDLDEFIFASQALQLEALKYWIEFWRSAKFNRGGILWWNLRDGWPIISDGITDYYGGKKIAYYYIKRVQRDTCVMILDAVDGRHPVVAVNDTRVEKKGTVTVTDLAIRKVLFSADFTVPINGKAIIGAIPQTGAQAMWRIDYTIAGENSGEKFTNHYLAGNPPFKLAEYKVWLHDLEN